MELGTIDLTSAIQSAVKALWMGVTSDHGKMAIGKPVLEAMRKHFSSLDSQRHHSWAKGVGYYQKAADNTHMDVVPDGVEIVTDSTGLNLRIHGGVVTAGKNKSCITGKPTQYLTIPAIAEAYGKGACEFNGLQFIKFGKGPDALAALVEKEPHGVTWFSTGKKVKNIFKQSKNKQGVFGRRVWFWLKRSTTHKPDPSVLPDWDALEAIALKSMGDYVSSLNI